MRTKNDKLHARQRTRIVDAAMVLFAEKGIRQTNMRDICAAVNLSSGGLYRYFESKEAIIAEIAALDAVEKTEWLRILTRENDVSVGLRMLIHRMVDTVTDPFYARLSLEIAAEAARNPAIGEPFFDADKEFHDALAAQLKSAQKRGDLSDRASPKDIVVFLMNAIDGLTANSAFPVKLPPRKWKKLLAEAIAQMTSP